MKTNNKNIASQALLEMDSINASLKNEAKDTMKSLLVETVKDVLRDIEDEDDYVVLEAKKGTKKSVSEDGEQELDPTAAAAAGAQEPAAEAPAEAPAEGGQMDMAQQPAAEGEAQAEPAADEADWSEFDQYKVGDNAYDLTGVEDKDTIVKVYKLLNSDDQVAIKKDGGKVELKDNETGAEYVIDLGEDDELGAEDEAAPLEDEVPAEGEGGQEQLAESEFFHNSNVSDEEQLDDLEPEYELDLDSEDEDEFDDEPAGFEFDDEDIDDEAEEMDFGRHARWDETEDEPLHENKRNRKKTMKESKEVIFEVDLGYTDDYQDKDPIAGLSNNEPSKSGKSWHKGLPTGTEKPWAGKGTAKKGDPFDAAVNEEFGDEEDVLGLGDDVEEIEEAATSKERHNRRRATKTNSRATGDRDYNPYVTKVDNGKLDETLQENKQLRGAIKELRKSLNEAYMTNVNLGKITKLFLENSTSKAEKVYIINRFTNEAKTAEQAQVLYESIDKQLKKNVKQTSTVSEGKQETKAVIKENNSKDLMNIIDFTNRVMNC